MLGFGFGVLPAPPSLPVCEARSMDLRPCKAEAGQQHTCAKRHAGTDLQ